MSISLSKRHSNTPPFFSPNDEALGSTGKRMDRDQREQILKWLARPGNAKLWFGVGKGSGKGRGFHQTAYDSLVKDLPFLSQKATTGIRSAIKKLKEARDAMGTPDGPKIIYAKNIDTPVVRVSERIAVPKDLLENAFAEIPRVSSHQIVEEPTPRETSEDTIAEPGTHPRDTTDNSGLEHVENAAELMNSILSLPTTATAPATTVSNSFPGRLGGSRFSLSTNVDEPRKERDYQREEAEERRNEREHERMRERYQWRKEEDERRSLYERESQTLRRLQDEKDHRKKLERADELHKRRLEQEEEMHRLRLKRMRFEFMKEHGISIDSVN